jgi:DNA-binding NarL/FixJ family response regulator
MSEDKYRVVIAEDYAILRKGLKALLTTYPRMEVVGEAQNGYEAIHQVETLKPDLLLLDLSMPRLHGLDAIREIKKKSVRTRILVLTVHKEEDYILAAFEAGADGYILKEASHNEFEVALDSVLSGKRYMSPDISEMVIEGYLIGKKAIKKETSWDTLTAREREILKLVAEGHTSKKIAAVLFLSAKTVERHRANLMKKLNLHSTPALTALALEKGLISR